MKKTTSMEKARAQLVLSQPFFAVLALRTRMVVDNTQPTGWCDGWRVGYNESYIDALPEAQRLGFICHELYHKIFFHMQRRGPREPKKWNVACDYAINILINDMATIELPSKTLLDNQYRDMTVETIYDLLPQSVMDGLKEAGEDPGGCGGVRDLDPRSSRMSKEELESRIKEDLSSACRVAKDRGMLPAGMEIYLDELTAPQVPWQQRLRRFMTERARADYSWSRPNRRYIHQGLYLPSMESEDMAGEFAFGVDTSGSMLDSLNIIMSEVNGVMEEVRPKKAHVLYCDAAVGRYDVFDQGEELVVSPKGGGGTDFRPVFDMIEEYGIQPKCLIFLTDGFGTFPTEAPLYPVMWVMTEDVDPPFGDVLRIDT